MKKVKKNSEPDLLVQHLEQYPNDEWESFCANNRDAGDQVKDRLKCDQRGICVYCEIDLLSNDQGKRDFRVEHFYPKKPHMEAPHKINYSLKWDNLFACCHGGSERYVCDPARFTSPDVSCDVDKGNHNWIDVILNPLDIPSFPLIFEYNEVGEMFVSDTKCPDTLKSKALESIEKLRLSPEVIDSKASRLVKFRKSAVDQLRSQIEELMTSQQMAFEEAINELANALYPSDSIRTWPAFFSCIRWYLGDAAEKRLNSIDYNG